METKNQDVIRDCLALSSGLLAVLTGRNQYAELDRVHAGFILFVAESADPFRTWVDAWVAFLAAGK